MALFRFAKNGECPASKGLFKFRTVQGGTSRLERHTSSHKNGSSIARFQRQLPASASSGIAAAAALAAALDIRPLSFCDGHAGMRRFAKTIFELGQTVPVNEKNDQSHIYLAEQQLPPL